MTTQLFLPLAVLALLAAGPLRAQDPAADPVQEGTPLSLEDRMLLRCSAAFALVAQGQQAGDAAALRHPPLAERGREYFVRSAAQVMDRARLDRPAISAALAQEAQDLQANGTLEAIMPVCLAALEDAGL